MSRHDKRFQFARLHLLDSSEALVRLLRNENDQSFPLKSEELTAAKDLVELCGRVLREIYEDCNEPGEALKTAVFLRSRRVSDSVIEVANRNQFERITSEETVEVTEAK